MCVILEPSAYYCTVNVQFNLCGMSFSTIKRYSMIIKNVMLYKTWFSKAARLYYFRFIYPYYTLELQLCDTVTSKDLRVTKRTKLSCNVKIKQLVLEVCVVLSLRYYRKSTKYFLIIGSTIMILL